MVPNRNNRRRAEFWSVGQLPVNAISHICDALARPAHTARLFARPSSSLIPQSEPLPSYLRLHQREYIRTRIRDVARSIRHGQGPCDSEGDLRVRLFPSLAGAGAFIRFPPSQNFSHRLYRLSRGWWKRMRTPWCFIRPEVRPPYRARHSYINATMLRTGGKSLTFQIPALCFEVRYS